MNVLDDSGAGFAMSGPLKPVHVPADKAHEHPLLRHAFIDDRLYVQWPGLTQRQRQVAGDSVTLMRADRVFSLPPRVNADWFLPARPTEDDLRTHFGRVADLQRWYLLIDLAPGSADVRLIAGRTVEGRREFFACQRDTEWEPVDAGTFVTWRDSDERMLVPTDQLVASEWRAVSRAAAARRRDAALRELLALTEPRSAAYWEARYEAARQKLTGLERQMLLDPDVDRAALELARRRLAWNVWNISKRVAESRRR